MLAGLTTLVILEPKAKAGSQASKKNPAAPGSGSGSKAVCPDNRTGGFSIRKVPFLNICSTPAMMK
jgi:hypothetical protein